MGTLLAIDAVGSNGVVDIRDGNDTGERRYLAPAQLVGIAAAVDALLVAAD